MNVADMIIHELMLKLYDDLDDNKYITSIRSSDSLVALACDNRKNRSSCDGCKYFKSRCLLSQVRELALTLSKLSEPDQYIVVAKSLMPLCVICNENKFQQIYGPTYKEDCESMAKNLENVEIKKCD